jgi:hypothetical protein
MTAEEARDYGIIDDIIAPRRGVAAPGRPEAHSEGTRTERELQVASA